MQKDSAFVVIYRFALLPEKEQRYQQLWCKVSNYFVESKGALGSALHKSTEGYWVAYSHWPDRATKSAAWMDEEPPNFDLPEAIKSAIIEMRACASQDKTWPLIEMDLAASTGLFAKKN